MYPGLHSWIEEFQPSTTNMEDDWVTQKQVLETEAGRHSPEIEQVPVYMKVSVLIQM